MSGRTVIVTSARPGATPADVHAELLRRGVAVEHRARDALGERLRLGRSADRRGLVHAQSVPSDCAARASQGDGR
jgi:hypothetical protein